MRSVPPALADRLQGGVLTLAKLVLIVRTDGVALGFTSSDRPVTFEGREYVPAAGLATSAIQQTVGTGVDNLDVTGVLSSPLVSAEDLEAGRYDGARIAVTLIDRTAPGLGGVRLLAGTLGEVETTDAGFRAEVRSLSQRLKQVVGDATSPTCRCRRLFDRQCKVDPNGTALNGAPNRRTRALASGGGATLTFAGDGAPDGHYAFGTVRFVTGRNAGIERDVKAHSNAGGAAALTLVTGFPYPFAAGDQAVLSAGCDRKFGTCGGKFGNANNFHGEEKIPTNDKIGKVGRPPA